MFKNYMRSKKYIIGILLLISLIFAIVFYFENMPVNTVVYAFILSFVSVLIIAVFDFLQHNKKCKKLKKSITNVPYIENFQAYNANGVEQLQVELIEALAMYVNDIKEQKTKNETEIIDFYTMWVHQIKTPIFALKLLIKKYPENSALLSELTKIEQYSDMVLNFVKLNDASTELDIKSHSVKEILSESIKDFSGVFISKKIKLKTNFSDLTIKTDKKWLKFIVDQVISNSLKYTEQGEICIDMSDNKIIIEDTGIGISAEDLPRVFEKGFTGKIGRLYQNSTGIGLYLCKKSADLLGVKINISSQKGRGTIVEIILNQKEIMFE